MMNVCALNSLSVSVKARKRKTKVVVGLEREKRQIIF